MNPFEQNEHLLHFLTSQVEREVIDYIRQEMQHDAPDSIPTEEELFAFFQSPDEPTKLDAYQPVSYTHLLRGATVILYALECVEYYGGTTQGVAAVFSALKQVGDIPVISLFSPEDIPGYVTSLVKDCPMCKACLSLIHISCGRARRGHSAF